MLAQNEVREAIAGRGGRNYQDLYAWQQAMDLTVSVYHIARAWPDDERFGLTSQIRRAVISIPSNIAEGQGRLSENEFIRFLAIAHGSLREFETQLLIAQRLGYSTAATIAPAMEQAAEIGRLIRGLIRKKEEDRAKKAEGSREPPH